MLCSSHRWKSDCDMPWFVCLAVEWSGMVGMAGVLIGQHRTVLSETDWPCVTGRMLSCTIQRILLFNLTIWSNNGFNKRWKSFSGPIFFSPFFFLFLTFRGPSSAAKVKTTLRHGKWKRLDLSSAPPFLFSVFPVFISIEPSTHFGCPPS